MATYTTIFRLALENKTMIARVNESNEVSFALETPTDRGQRNDKGQVVVVSPLQREDAALLIQMVIARR